MQGMTKDKYWGFLGFIALVIIYRHVRGQAMCHDMRGEHDNLFAHEDVDQRKVLY
jgi:hypothetical protein